METIVGLLFWGGLLVLVSRWVMRSSRGSSPRTPDTPASPSLWRSTAPPAVEESARETGALVDGLIIGHHLTRTHYQDRLAEQAETIHALRADAVTEAYLGDDDRDDLEEAHGPGGYGAVGYGAVGDADGFGEVEDAGSAELDGFGGTGDPWDDDIFGYDEDEDD